MQLSILVFSMSPLAEDVAVEQIRLLQVQAGSSVLDCRLSRLVPVFQQPVAPMVC